MQTCRYLHYVYIFSEFFHTNDTLNKFESIVVFEIGIELYFIEFFQKVFCFLFRVSISSHFYTITTAILLLIRISIASSTTSIPSPGAARSDLFATKLADLDRAWTAYNHHNDTRYHILVLKVLHLYFRISVQSHF